MRASPQVHAGSSTGRGPQSAVRETYASHGSSFSFRLDIEHLRPAEGDRQGGVIHQDENDGCQAEVPRAERTAVLEATHQKEQDENLEDVSTHPGEHHRLRADLRGTAEREDTQAKERGDDGHRDGSADDALVAADNSAQHHHDGGHYGRHGC